ncbi:AraC family transcriptional regulator [Streptomyces fuscichromogenes]|uniref:HTH araC/xylS-type domain-containing protein n=1 Tax=Streptomyces fuscichromogenes TaxID=1324013 RepID=A0A917XPJ2_9ACTN|nr:helix-turn-helix transcriptional regulator [Streptomyces fuscichromogenes]GGN44316.1 hypothetical protein GCM10011578_095140 [Streptomyces fuscichromogenes]
MRTVTVHLDTPPQVVNVGVGVHGPAGHTDVFRLPDLWQLHVYGYAADLTVGDTPYPIRPGRVSLVPPATTVRYHYHQDRSEHLYAHLLMPSTGAARSLPVLQDAGAGLPALNAALLQAIAAAPTEPGRVTAETWSALWRIAHLTPPPPRTGPHPAFTAAVTHIESQLADPLTVPGIARTAGISHNHLIRLFRAETGDTVVSYIRHRRLERARHLLCESTLSIAAVAAAVGIPDLQAFNKACRRELGGSPRAVRGRGGSGHAEESPGA